MQQTFSSSVKHQHKPCAEPIGRTRRLPPGCHRFLFLISTLENHGGFVGCLLSLFLDFHTGKITVALLESYRNLALKKSEVRIGRIVVVGEGWEFSRGGETHHHHHHHHPLSWPEPFLISVHWRIWSAL